VTNKVTWLPRPDSVEDLHPPADLEVQDGWLLTIKNFPGHHKVNGWVANRQAPEV